MLRHRKNCARGTPGVLREVIIACELCASHNKPKLQAEEEDSASPDKMKELNSNPEDGKLGSLLREARAVPALPPRFQDNVWRRIESAEARTVSAGDSHRFDALVSWLLRPRLAFAVATLLVLTGVGLGWSRGEQLARHNAQARYLAAVAPNSLR